jgi:hypothetical protein
MLEISSLEKYGSRFEAIDKPDQEALKARLRLEIRENTWDSASGIVAASFYQR